MRNVVKRTALGIVAAASAALVAVGTYAWFNAKDHVDNAFGVSFGEARIVEVFTPPHEWTPGQSIEKQVAVANTSTEPVFARLSFEEALVLLSADANAHTLPDVTGSVPQLCEPTAYESATWATADAAGLAVHGLPAGVQLRVNGNTIAPGTTAQMTTYSFAAWRPITEGGLAGKCQRVTADYAVEAGTVTMSNVRYWALSELAAVTGAWFATPPATANMGAALTDSGGQLGFSYHEPARVAGAAPTVGSWWYNQQDGYFYYVGLLEKEQTSPSLLTGVQLAAEAPSSYAGMRFDLTVHMDAIQNTREALTSASGWNLADDGTLVQALAPYCS